MKNAKQPDRGVFYALADHAGILRRLCIVAVDFAVLLGLGALLFVAGDRWEWIPQCPVELWLLAVYLYMAVLKMTPWGTVGYLLTGVRLVDLRGRRPSLWRVTLRLIFLVLGPINMLFDIIWLGGDPNRQSIRDKFAGTYVIRKRAVPAGEGRVKYVTYFFLCHCLTFEEIERADIGPPLSQG